MKIRSLLGLLALAGVIVGSMVLSGPVQAATGIGPTIDIAATAVIPSNPTNDGLLNSSNTVIVGNDVVVSERVTTITTDPFRGYNASWVWDSTDLTWVSFTDQSTGPLAGGNFWTASLCLDSGGPINFGGALTPPQVGGVISCSATGAASVDTNKTGPLADIQFTTATVGVTAVHMVEPVEAGAGAAAFSAYTINASPTDQQTNTYTCTAPGASGVTVPAVSPANPLCPIIPPSPFNSVAIQIVDPPPNVSMTKSAGASPIVAGQAAQFVLTINNPSSTTAATNVQVSDTLPAAFLGASVTFSGANAGDCSISGQVVSCGPFSVAAGGTWTVNIDVGATDANSGGTSPVNTACLTLAEADPDTANNCDTATIQILAPAVAWSKSPTSANLFLAGPGPFTFTFQEIMTNQGDPNGLGGFSFDLRYDPTQYLAPSFDFSPAIALFAASGRTLDCSITQPANGIVHVACASTGTFGVGPVFTGPQVMANVTLTVQQSLVQSIRPNKENGDLSFVKDDQVTVTNTCGQPLNDGTIQPLPGQPECQGDPLQGVGPGGVLEGNPNGGESVQAIRRLEGDVDKDCGVNVSDMQLEASKFGTAVGSLLYNLFYDVNSPLANGDGRIDIQDVQFVYGRFGSTCASPIPPQPVPALP